MSHTTSGRLASDMYHPRHARPHRYVVLAAVAAVVVVTGVAFGLALARDLGQPSRPEVTSGVVPNGAVPAASEGPSMLDRCRSQRDAQGPVLRAAAHAIEQWEVHVGAMNQLVAGEITLDQASAFWNRTRVGARDRVAAFGRADTAYADRGHDCPAQQDTGAATWRACARSVALRDEVTVLARRAIDTWAGHVQDMERLRDGQLSPTKATRMWRMSWHMGQHQIDAYHDAIRRADRAEACAG